MAKSPIPVRRRRRFRSRPLNPVVAAQIERLLRTTTLTQHEIAAAVGVNQGRVSEVNSHTGARFSRRRRPPASRRVNAAIAAEIKKLLLTTRMSQHQIAAALSVNQGRVSEIATGKKWAHIRPAP